MSIIAQLVLVIFVVFTIWAVKTFILEPKAFMDYYTKQGITMLKGADRPVLGNLLDFKEYNELAVASPYRMESPINWVAKKTVSDDGLTYDSSKHRGYIISFWNQPIIVFTDPKIVEEMFTVKNKLIDKTRLWVQTYEDFMPNAFIFEPASDGW